MVRRAPQAVPLKGESLGGSPEQEEYMKKLAEQFTITPEYLQKICDHFMAEMDKGLNNEGQTVAMIPSYVEGRLTGKETRLTDENQVNV